MTMKAITFARYGGPEVLEYVDAPLPSPGPGEVLVRQRAASINAADYRIMRADPFLVRFFAGLFRPKNPWLGIDLAGVVEGVGPGVTRFKPGDAVFGECFTEGLGSLAEFVHVSEEGLALKPESVSFDEAAAVPLAGITALQALRDTARVEPSQRVLVQGAGGGVGTFAVQIAKAMGAHVTAVCGPKNVALMESFGADGVIDYTREDFVDRGELYDAILGVNGYRSLGEYKRSLSAGGRYVLVGGGSRQLFAAILLGSLRFAFSGKSARLLTVDKSKRRTDMEQLAAWLGEGAIRPVIERSFPLAEAADAFRYVEQGHVRGKVIVRTSSKNIDE